MERGSIYPSWRYHADGSSELCLTPERDAEMGDAWSDEDIRQIGDRAPQAAPATEPQTEPEAEAAPKKRGRKPKA